MPGRKKKQIFGVSQIFVFCKYSQLIFKVSIFYLFSDICFFFVKILDLVHPIKFIRGFDYVLKLCCQVKVIPDEGFGDGQDGPDEPGRVHDNKRFQILPEPARNITHIQFVFPLFFSPLIFCQREQMF